MVNMVRSWTGFPLIKLKIRAQLDEDRQPRKGLEANIRESRGRKMSHVADGGLSPVSGQDQGVCQLFMYLVARDKDTLGRYPGIG